LLGKLLVASDADCNAKTVVADDVVERFHVGARLVAGRRGVKDILVGVLDYLIASLLETLVAPFASVINKHKTFCDFKDTACLEISVAIAVADHHITNLQFLSEVVFHVGEKLLS
jgi:hypothetical protein